MRKSVYSLYVAQDIFMRKFIGVCIATKLRMGSLIQSFGEKMRYKLIELNNAWVIQDLNTFKLVGFYTDEEDANGEYRKLNSKIDKERG